MADKGTEMQSKRRYYVCEVLQGDSLRSEFESESSRSKAPPHRRRSEARGTMEGRQPGSRSSLRMEGSSLGSTPAARSTHAIQGGASPTSTVTLASGAMLPAPAPPPPLPAEEGLPHR